MPNQSGNVAVRAFFGVLIWLVLVLGAIAVARAVTQPPRWLLIAALALAIGFDAFCLTDIARAPQVRYLPKWVWVLICLAQTPGGGIMYLSLGHIGRPRPAPPGDATP